MNAKSRFDKIIQEIESRVGDPFLDAQKLSEELASSNALLLRDMITVFKYLTGNTLRAYICDRRMMASYKFLITEKKRNIERALEIAGYGDQPGYTKAFRKRFGMSPGEAFKKKDFSLYEKPLSWDILSQEGYVDSDEADSAIQEEGTHFGIKLNQYDKIAKAMELEAFYDFSPVYSQFAFDLSEQISKPISDTFRFVDSLREYLWTTRPEDESLTDDMKPLKETLREYGEDEFYQQMFFEKNIGLSTIEYFQFNHDATREELLSCNEDMLAAFSETYEMSFHYFMKAWEAFMKYTDGEYNLELFESFVKRLDSNMPIEDALAEIPFDVIMDSYPEGYDGMDDSIDSYYSEIDEILEKAYNQWDSGRIDEEPDIDNLGYYDEEEKEDYEELSESPEEILLD